MPVSFGTALASGGAPPVNVVCTRESGSSFPIGSTAVTCTATDSRQRADSCSFNVNVVTPPRIGLTRFVAFGDSITYGENGAIVAFAVDNGPRPHFQVQRTYPTVLFQSLASRYTAQQILVANQGAPSERARDSETQARFSSVVRSGGYDVVLLMEGTNDLSDGFGQAAISGLRNMVRDAKSRGVQPYIATVPPMDGLSCCPRRGSAAPLVPGFNDQIRGIASSEGIPLVEVYDALNASPREFIGPDGLHPTEAGYAKIGEVFFNAVKSKLEAPTATPTFVVPQTGFRPLLPLRRR